MDKQRNIMLVPMEPHHLDAIVTLERGSFAIPWTRGMFEEELKNSLARYYVLLLDGQVAGYAGMWIIVNEGHITNIAVDAACRRQGIGKKVLEHLLEEGKKMGVDSFTLEVRRSNAPALELYGSCGFKPVGIRKKYYSDNGEDAVIMWRDHG